MAGSSVLGRLDERLRNGPSTLIGRMPVELGSRWGMDRGAYVTGGILEAAGLPPLLATMMRPWVAAVETGTLGMRDAVAATASSTASSLRRRVAVEPALDAAIVRAVEASVALAEALDRRDARPTPLRTKAVAALVALIEQLRTAEPSEDTRALGLGW